MILNRYFSKMVDVPVVVKIGRSFLAKKSNKDPSQRFCLVTERKDASVFRSAKAAIAFMGTQYPPGTPQPPNERGSWLSLWDRRKNDIKFSPLQGIENKKSPKPEKKKPERSGSKYIYPKYDEL